LGLTPAQLIQTYLVGPGITVTNAKFNGSSSIITSVELGSFVASGNAMTQMGLDSGLIMTCGQADSAIGPNDNCGAGLANMEPGDADLSALADTNTNDACVLEFDFVPLSDTIRFRYVFASEEFFTFCYRYNDPSVFFSADQALPDPFPTSARISH